jgi:hypothetical protein
VAQLGDEVHDRVTDQDGYHATAYALARYLARRVDADTIIDVGPRSVGPPTTLRGIRRIIVDAAAGPDADRPSPAKGWLVEGDGTEFRRVALTEALVGRSIVVCAGVAERVANPTPLMEVLARLSRQAPATIVTATDRGFYRGAASEEACVHACNGVEFRQLLGRHGLRPALTGLMSREQGGRNKDTIISICDQCPLEAGKSPPDDFRPLALVTTYNDRDIVGQIVAKFLDDGIEVLVHDNWSVDGTYEQLTALAAERPRLSVERFPQGGPSRYFDLRTICRMKEEIAVKHPGRWIIHHDSDEIRSSPWVGVSLRGGLYVADRMGYTAVDFTVCEFRPVTDGISPSRDLEREIRYFEYSRVPAHFDQIKAWRQGSGRVDLGSGGHHAEFPGRRVFPYKFLLKHYPLRSTEQARRKIFDERRPRYSPEERSMGWHTHYDQFTVGDRFVWDAGELIDFEAPETRSRYLVESIAGIGIRQDGAEVAPRLPPGDRR